jgi:hypothetical protein
MKEQELWRRYEAEFKELEEFAAPATEQAAGNNEPVGKAKG